MFIAFDLDGTIADPSVGVTGCINHTLETLGLPLKPVEDLLIYIGPPTEWIFGDLLQTEDNGTIENARKIFGRRYREWGYLQNTIYKESHHMLNSLLDDDHFLTIVTSKSSRGAERVAEEFEFSRYFKGVYGRVNDCSKIDSLRMALDSTDVRPAAMVGDRKYDVEAAKHWGITSIGVTWGFGTVDELKDADHIVNTRAELLEVIKRISM